MTSTLMVRSVDKVGKPLRRMCGKI